MVTKAATLPIRLQPTDLERLREAAQIAGKPVSTLVREAALNLAAVILSRPAEPSPHQEHPDV
jgi:uncharacterized protein (DUF1778 family)